MPEKYPVVPIFTKVHGRIHFSLKNCEALKNEAISREAEAIKLPKNIQEIWDDDPDKRMALMTVAIEEAGISLEYNETTIHTKDWWRKVIF